MLIQTIDSLSLTPYWHGVIPSRAVSRQGSMDGACGPYALFNALVLGNHIKFDRLEKIWSQSPDDQTKLGNWQSTCGPMLLHGTDHEDLEKLLDALTQYLRGKRTLRLVSVLKEKEYQHQKSQARSMGVLEAIKSEVTQNKPVLVWISCPKFDHWAVAVGFQEHIRNGKPKLAHILMIDPSEFVPKLHAWNGILGLGYQRDLRLRYTTEADSEAQSCAVRGAWSLEPA